MTRSITGTLIVLVSFARPAQALYVAPAFPNLSFDFPVDIQDPRDGTDRLFVVERAGLIHVFENDVSATSKKLFLDISSEVTTQSEGGLLGLAFHPNYENNGYFYVCYTDDDPTRRTIVARFTRSAGNPDLANPNSELYILEIPQDNLYHKGGCLTFGPDGYLYISLGEDGAAHLAQDLATFNGKLLRIDVDNPSGGENYGIPASNPFEGNNQGYLEEIYAYGFRNPWRFSIDVPTGRIWLGDVGAGTYEEVDLVLKGRNYGWPRMEGPDCFQPQSCDTTGLNVVAPLYYYVHAGSASITGGYVYRGTTVPTLAGKYVYSDYITGEIWALTYTGGTPTNQLIYDQPAVDNISSFGTDVNNELYFTSFDGKVYRFFSSVTAVDAPSPAAGALHAVHPNPFGSSTTISYTLEEHAHTRLDVFDVRGRSVVTVLDESLGAGAHDVDWNGRGGRGEILPGGIYFLRLTIDGRIAGSRRVVLIH